MTEPSGELGRAFDARPGLRTALRWVGVGFASLAWLITVVLVVLQVMRWFHLRDGSPNLVALWTVWPLVALSGLVVVIVAVARRRRILGIAAVAVAAIVITAWWPAWAGRVGPGPADAFRMRLLALNVQYTIDDGAAVSRQVAAANPDVVVLTELSPNTLRELDLKQYPYSWQRPTTGAFGQGIWSRWPLEQTGTVSAHWRAKTISMPELSVRTPAGPVRLLQVHPPAPTNRTDIRPWKEALAGIDARLEQGSAPVIAAGDFNASRWVPEYAALLGGPNDIRDAGQGRGFLATWPETGEFSGGPLFFPLDHILVSRGIGVRSFRVLGRSAAITTVCWPT